MTTYGKPFDRKTFLKEVSDYVEKGWGTYKELITLTMKDFLEIKVGIESRANEEQLQQGLRESGGGFYSKS